MAGLQARRVLSRIALSATAELRGRRLIGIRVMIAAAGGAAHRRGHLGLYLVAGAGVPIQSSALHGLDSLLVAQMPGIPVNTSPLAPQARRRRSWLQYSHFPTRRLPKSSGVSQKAD